MSSHPITPEDLQAFRSACQDSMTRVAAHALSRTDLQDVCYVPAEAKKMIHKFSLEIPGMAACDQKASGRCWIFASLNILREQLAKEKNLPDFRLSQNYIAFYDHLEKANGFLQNVLDTGFLPMEDRYVSRLFSEPVGDGGWWEYFVGLTQKYGLVPEDAMPDTFQSSHTENMNMVLNMQLRKDGLRLRQALAEGETPDTLSSLKKEMLSRGYRFLTICLGTPPERFDFEYCGKDGVYHADRDLTPRSFYESHIGTDLTEIVSILNAPLPSVPYYSLSYVRGEESIHGAYQARRLNLPMKEFKAAVLRQLSAGEPVWFVCDSDYFGNKQEGIWHTGLYDYETPLGLELHLEKGDLLLSRQSSLNHAMVLTGVNLSEGVPDRWKAENSWGADIGSQGYFVLSDQWFDRYVYTASIRKEYLTAQEKECFSQEPLVLEPWSVIG